jgi:hypothetical protein
MVKLDKLDRQLLDIVCGQKCKFYKEGQEEKEKEYQCGAYKILKTMIDEGQLSLEELKKIALKVNKNSIP